MFRMKIKVQKSLAFLCTSNKQVKWNFESNSICSITKNKILRDKFNKIQVRSVRSKLQNFYKPVLPQQEKNSEIKSKQTKIKPQNLMYGS